MTLRQNMHIGICNGAAMEQAIWEDGKGLEFEAGYEIELETGVTGT